MLHTVALLALGLAVLCSLWIAVDVLRHPQKMWIMNAVWILTPLYSGLVGLWAYYQVGRLTTKQNVRQAKARGEESPGKQKPFWQSVAVGALHCGSGCTLADMLVETAVFFVPVVLFGHKLFGAWAVDFVFAFLFGIVFQYFTIKPMRDLSVGEGIKAAVKADTFSLTAWQVGMYGWMAIATFALFGHELKANDPVFWLMMQLAMVAGFLTAYPVNWWLLRSGMKEVM